MGDAEALSAAPASDRPAWRALIAVTLAATLFTAVQGLTYPLLALLLDRRAVPEGLIGLNAAMMPLGMILAAPLAQPLLARFGALPLIGASLAGASLTLLSIGLIRAPLAWMPLRLLAGICLALVFILGDTWVNELAAPRLRGRILGLYAMCSSLGFAFGPLLLAALGTRGFAPFAAGGLLGVAALVPLLLARRELPSLRTELAAAGLRSVGLLAFVRRAPLLTAGVGATALADQVALSLLPIFCLRHGLTVTDATAALVAMIAGGTLLPYPIGWLADRVSARALYFTCALLTAASALALPLAVASRALLGIVVFVWGGSYYAIFTLALVLLGRRFSGSALLAGNAVFAAIWGLGGLLGTPLTGALMQRFGPNGFAVALAAVFLALALATIRRRKSGAGI